MHRNPECSGGSGCHRRSEKTATLWLSGGCHPTERRWMEGASSSGPRSKRRLVTSHHHD
ncbi:unnamed protein product [Spirodela intermedia]|uniref:Uncharacterized protein n=1 Tax=Spirodela intermedia TaxID=51605 RepID=A0ABN7E9Q6_SPIIN|nr:unnamed protein product [Spirodela intermedia]